MVFFKSESESTCILKIANINIMCIVIVSKLYFIFILNLLQNFEGNPSSIRNYYTIIHIL